MRDKVYELLRTRPQGATRQEISQVLFAAPGGDPGVAAQIVDTLLQGDERFFVREEEGRWFTHVPETRAKPLEETTFVVVDLETTSLGTSVHHIIEIAAARVRSGKVVDEFSCLVNPGIRLPPFITHLTGIDDTMLQDQPTIFEVWSGFLEFLGKDVLVAHNASFDLSFLNTVSSLRNGVALANPVLCTLKLARRLLPELKRRGLDALAAHFGIPQIERHRALGDVRITSEVLFHLLERAAQRGAVTLEQVLDLQDHARDGVRFESFLPRDKLNQLPAEPGIYRLYDEQGRLLYVGRARNLRERVGSYLSNASNHSDKTLQLIRQAHDVRVEVLESELEAALTEASAIRREKPPFNRLAKHLPRVAFIKLTLGDPFPRLAITMRPRRGRSRYFGPFRDRLEAEQIIGLLTRLFQLRTCPGLLAPALSVTPCFEGQVGACTAPCALRVSLEQYRQQADQCMQLLEGYVGTAERMLTEQRDRFSECARFEDAARAQRDIELLSALVGKQRTRRWIAGSPNLLILQPARQRVVLAYVVLGGRLVLRTKLYAADDVARLAEQVETLLGAPQSGSREDQIDGMSIVASWLRQHGERDGYVFPLDNKPAPETKRPATQVEEWRAACSSLLSITTC